MERKNTVLLTVIAIATLLVAVVGATFAYFTAQFTVQNGDNGKNKIDATTAVFPSVSFDYGDKISVTDDLYPGYKFLKKVHVKGTCQNEKEECKTVGLVLTLKPDIPDAFEGNVKYAVYKASSTHSNAITCDNQKKQETDPTGIVKYTYDGKCTATDGVFKGTNFDEAVSNGVIDETGYSGVFKTQKDENEDVTVLIEDIDGTTDDYYYIVVDYYNNPNEAQNDEQGLDFSVTLDASLQP